MITVKRNNNIRTDDYNVHGIFNLIDLEAEDNFIIIEYFECTTQQQENVRNDICDGVRGALAVI